MQIVVSGSIASDHLMTYSGRFSDAIVADKLSKISVSFLADELEIRRGGVGANICFGMGILGIRPALVGSAGADFDEYGSWLASHGVDLESVKISNSRHTARFVCTTDAEANQIATFYPGAMQEAREISMGEVTARLGGIGLAVISANDPAAMLRHTQECRDMGIPFAADPSQQLSSISGTEIQELIDGATYLFSNEYEAALIEGRSGWSASEILERVGTRVTTLGAQGSRIQRFGEPPIHVLTPKEKRRADPTGVGDAFRAGFLAALTWGLPAERCAQLGSLLATYVIESVGTQEYQLSRRDLLNRAESTYGSTAALEIAEYLTALPS